MNSTRSSSLRFAAILALAVALVGVADHVSYGAVVSAEASYRRPQVDGGSEDAPIGRPFEFQGLITEMHSGYWIVSSHAVLVTVQTDIQGQPQVGALAEVKAVQSSADTLLARKIKVIAAGAPIVVEFEGVLEDILDEVAIVSGVSVMINPATSIYGVATPGLVVEVRAWQQPDGTLLAEQIWVQDATVSSELDIEGLVQSISDQGWLVGGQEIHLDAGTLVDESRAPAEAGLWAQVHALRQNNSLWAVRILLSRPR